MDFKYFPLSRDLLYLTSILVGAALGCFVTLFRNDINKYSRNRRITLSLIFFSVALASFALALICSQTRILTMTRLFLPVGLCGLVVLFSVSFPRTIAYPVILLFGVFVIWEGYTFLRFPLIQESSVPLAVVSNNGNGQFSLHYQGNGDRALKSDAEKVLVFHSAAGEPQPLALEFSAVILFRDPVYPLAGGERRGLVQKIRNGNQQLFEETRLHGRFLNRYYQWLNSGSRHHKLGIGCELYAGETKPDYFPIGMKLSVFANENDLSFAYNQ
jgi:hypothetical protein